MVALAVAITVVLIRRGGDGDGLRLVDVASGRTSRLLTDVNNQAPAWSADSQRLAAVVPTAGGGLGAGVTSIIDRGRPETRTFAATGSLSWSRDGLLLAGVDRASMIAGAATVQVLDLRTGRVSSLATLPVGLNRGIGLALSPQGTTLAVTADHGGHPGLALLDVATRALTWINDDDAIEQSVRWSGDGTKLLYVSSDGGATLRSISVADRRHAPTTLATVAALGGTWSDDGTHYAVISAGILLVTDATTGHTTRFDDPTPAQSVVWSPDDRQLAAVTSGGIDLLDASTGRVVRTLVKSGRRALLASLAWSPDGRSVAYVQQTLPRFSD